MKSTLASWILFAGIAVGFALACGEGHRAAGYSKPPNFHRFHRELSQDTSFHPPFAMMEALAKSRHRPGRTLVIIGGSSVMNGVGQTADSLWSDRLQSLLGEPYAVLNFGLRGARATHGAIHVAESLQRQGYPVIFIADAPPADPRPAVAAPHGYLYWQALAQDRLAPWELRDQEIAAWLPTQPAAERRRVDEERLAGILEARFRFQSLWHHIGLKHVFTVWNFLTADRFWQPRATAADNEPASPPLEERYRGDFDHEIGIVSGNTSGIAVPTAPDEWTLTRDTAEQMRVHIAANFVPALRPRSLIVLVHNSPYYVSRLQPAERKRDHQIYEQSARVWRDLGIAAVTVGEDFSSADFHDRVHLANCGGEKLANLVAAQIRLHSAR